MPVFFSLFSEAEPFCNNFDYSQNPCLLRGLLTLEGPKFEAEGRERERVSWGRGSEPHYGVWGSAVSSPLGVRAGPRQQIHFGPTKSLENVSSDCKRQTQFNFFTERRQSAEPLDTTGGTLRLKNTGIYSELSAVTLWQNQKLCVELGDHTTSSSATEWQYQVIKTYLWSINKAEPYWLMAVKHICCNSLVLF